MYKTAGAVFTSSVMYLALAFSVLAMFAFDLVLLFTIINRFYLHLNQLKNHY